MFSGRKKVTVNQYKMDRIKMYMKKEFGAIASGKEEPYFQMLYVIETNMLKVKLKNPEITSRKAIEAISMELLKIDGYLRNIEYNFMMVENEDNKKLCEALQYAYNPFENDSLYEVMKKNYEDESIFTLKKVFKDPVMCFIHILKSIEFWISEKGFDGYFDILRKDFLTPGFEYKPMNSIIKIPEDKTSLLKDDAENRYITSMEDENGTRCTKQMDYLVNHEYIELFGYPIMEIDIFIIEIANIIGNVADIEGIEKEITKKLAKQIAEASRKFFDNCKECKYKCLEKPLESMDFTNLIEKGLKLEEYPKVMQHKQRINLIYFEYSNEICIESEDFLSKYISNERAKELAESMYYAIIKFISDNCWEDCDNNCILNWDESGYCSMCKFSMEELPCPMDKEISFKTIKAKRADFVDILDCD